MSQNYTPLKDTQDTPIPPLFDGSIDIKPPPRTGRGTLVFIALGILSLGAGIGGGFLMLNRGVDLKSMAAVTQSNQVVSTSSVPKAACTQLGTVNNIKITCPNCAKTQ